MVLINDGIGFFVTSLALGYTFRVYKPELDLSILLFHFIQT